MINAICSPTGSTRSPRPCYATSIARRFLGLLVFPLSIAAPALGDDMIGVERFGNVYTIDSTTGAGTFLAHSGANHLDGLAVSPDGTYYTMRRLVTLDPISEIMTIDPVTGQAHGTGVMIPWEINGLGFAPNGVLWGIGEKGTPGTVNEDWLLSIDVNTGAVSVKGNTGLVGIWCFTVGQDGNLWAWDRGLGFFLEPGKGLIRLNPANAKFTDVDPNDAGTAVSVLHFMSTAPDGSIFAGHQSMFSIDTATGKAQPSGNGSYQDLTGVEFLRCATSYGTGCPGSGNFVPTLALPTCPSAGSQVTLTIGNALGGANALLLIGQGQGETPIGSGCALQILPLPPVIVSLPLGGIGPGMGFVAVAATVPPGLSGLTLTMQALVQDPGTSGGLAGSKGTRISFP